MHSNEAEYNVFMQVTIIYTSEDHKNSQNCSKNRKALSYPFSPFGQNIYLLGLFITTAQCIVIYKMSRRG